MAWSRISSKVIAHPPDAEAACTRRCGNGKSRLGSLYRRWVTNESRSDHDPLQKGDYRISVHSSLGVILRFPSCIHWLCSTPPLAAPTARPQPSEVLLTLP